MQESSPDIVALTKQSNTSKILEEQKSLSQLRKTLQPKKRKRGMD